MRRGAYVLLLLAIATVSSACAVRADGVQPTLPDSPSFIGQPIRGADGRIVPSTDPPSNTEKAPAPAPRKPEAIDGLPGSAAAAPRDEEKAVPSTTQAPAFVETRPDFVIPYSRGVLSYDRYPRISVGPAGDVMTCTEAAEVLPRGGAGGVIEFLPGEHTTWCGNLGQRGNILVTGRLGPNGERPRITTPSPGDGTDRHRPFLVFNSNRADDLVVQNLDLHNTGQAINVWNYGGMVMRNVRITDTNGADAVKVYPTDRWETQGYKWQSWLEIYDSEVSRGGSGNTKHNFYIGRIERVLVDRLYTHSALGSHAFKAIARNLTIRNSSFATTERSFDEALSDPFLSTTLVDISACSRSLIENSRFIGLKLHPSDRPGFADAGRLGTSTASFIDLKRRKSKVGGCDEPGYADAFRYDWKGAAAHGLTRDNPALFHHVIRDNEFVNIGRNDILLVRNVGTAYTEDNNVSFTRGKDLPLPPHWFERAIAWLIDNRLRGPIEPGEEWSDHPSYPQGAPIFINGRRLGVVHRSAPQESAISSRQ